MYALSTRSTEIGYTSKIQVCVQIDLGRWEVEEEGKKKKERRRMRRGIGREEGGGGKEEAEGEEEERGSGGSLTEIRIMWMGFFIHKNKIWV